MTFKTYLKLGQVRSFFTDDSQALFATQALAEKTFRDYGEEEWGHLEKYLIKNGAETSVIDAAQKLFRNWRAGQ